MFVNKIDPKTALKLFQDVLPKLESKNLSSRFIFDVLRIANYNPAMHNFLALYNTSESSHEMDELVADMQDLLNDLDQLGKKENVYIRFDDLEKISKQIDVFKNSLLIIINEKIGSISELSKMTGIPQPSLSRFFNSKSMPRKVTLLKIAKALNLSQVEIATEWSA